MNKTIEVILSLRSWVFLGGMLGLCGGAVFGILSAAYAMLIKHDFAAAVQVLIGALISFPFTFALFALVGYPVYRFVLCKSSSYRRLKVVEIDQIT